MTTTSRNRQQMTSPPHGTEAGDSLWHKLFAVLAGGLLGLALLKFGNPIIFDKLIGRPNDMWEILFQPWPITWGYALLGILVLLSLKTVRFKSTAPSWLVFLPIAWLIWQCLAGLGTIEPTLTRPTLIHFASCVLWFYFGLFGLGNLRQMIFFWLPAIMSFILVLWIGFEQHYGGLEATRRFFYEQPDWQKYPPEYLKRMASDRIFSTLVYPNALAGAILLYLPASLASIWVFAHRLPRLSRCVVTGLVAYLGLACLFWSGSKAGWLIALLMTVVLMGQVPFPKKAKIGIAAIICAIGLIAFSAKFAGYFQKGATSVVARLDYWRAAVTVARQNLVLGSGPGTFSINYAKLKPPQAEMARLVHNDYLEQASDSGLIGMALYVSFLLGSIQFLYRKRRMELAVFWFPTWLGLLGWALHSFVEFPLYIPGLAWPAFALLGSLIGSGEGK